LVAVLVSQDLSVLFDMLFKVLFMLVVRVVACLLLLNILNIISDQLFLNFFNS